MDETAERIHDVGRVLGEIPSPQSLFASFMKTEEEDDNKVQNLKLKCSKDENEFTKLKLALIQAETKSKMIEFLFNKPLEEWPAVDKANNKENFDQVKEDLKNTKQEVEDLEEKLTGLVEGAQEKLEIMEQKKKDAEDILSTVEMKKTKLESLKAIHEQSLVGLGGVKMEGTDLPAKLQIQREALRTTELALQKCDLLLTEHKRAVSRLQERCCMARAIEKECQQTVQTIQRQKAERDEGTKGNQEWLEKSLHALKQITGISNIRVEDQTVTLDLVCNGSPSQVKAVLKMTFKCLADGESKLIGAQLGQEMLDCSDVISEAISLNDPALLIRELGQEMLDCSDVISEAIRLNDPALLIREVKRRLDNHAPVLQEVERLRHQYAIDYVHEERRLHAMFGSSGQIVCTLTIDNGYPTTGKASLTKIEGNGHHKDLSQYQPPMGNPTMSDWLVYLEDQL